MPTKTIYVANDDQPIFERAQQLAGDNLSSVIVRALQEFVRRHENQTKGLKEVAVYVGTSGLKREQRFRGRLVFKWSGFDDEKTNWLNAKVYITAKHNWAIELRYQPHAKEWEDWRNWMKSYDLDYTECTQLIVLASIAEADEKLPKALAKLVASAAQQAETPTEYLDI